MKDQQDILLIKDHWPSRERSDRGMNYLLGGFFLIGLLLSPFYGTWAIAMVVGGFCLGACHVTRFLFPTHTTYQYVLSAALGIFMAQYVYQMRGMFEMHFFAFVGSAALIAYQNWRLQIPLATVVLLHHAIFGYLHFTGQPGVYFSELNAISLETFIIHIVLACTAFTICGLWAHHFHASSRQQAQQNHEIEVLHAVDQQKETLLSEKQRAEAELARSYSLINATLESTADGILVTNFSGKIVLFNKKFAALWGFEDVALATMNEEALLAHSLHKLADPADFLFAIKKIYLQPDSESYHLIRFKDGTILERHSLPQKVEGKSVGRVWNFRDVTARIESEEKLEQQNRELVKTNAELDRFVYSASHELRAPLTSILGLISIAQMDESDAAKVKILELMQTSVERLDIFIRDIVNYSGNSRLELVRDKIDFEEVIHGCLEQLRYMPEMEKVSIFTEIHGDYDFYSDRRRITVALSNLLSNAIKYQRVDQDKPYIHISVRITPSRADISISDNGTGIAEEYQDKIFNMFYRATERKSGTGLGLYIVKEVVDRLQGEVSVESTLGKGSTFHMSLPSNVAS
jgi:PAS domain S-box-containing protein